MITGKDCWLCDSCIKNKTEQCKYITDDEYCSKLFKLTALYDESLLSNSQRKHTALYTDADGTDQAEFMQLSNIEKNIVKFVQNGTNLYIHSAQCGNGKTAWSIRLIQAYLGQIWPESNIRCRALFINVPRFLLELKNSISMHSDYIDHIKANILKADLVVWDEVATKALTTYEHEHLLSLINARLDEGKSNIYTSNLSSQDLQEVLGDRLYSRIVHMSTEIAFNGKDKRGIK